MMVALWLKFFVALCLPAHRISGLEIALEWQAGRSTLDPKAIRQVEKAAEILRPGTRRHV